MTQTPRLHGHLLALLGLTVGLLAACGDDPAPTPAATDGDDGTVIDDDDDDDSGAGGETGDSTPCDCDDGLWCNGAETCDDAGDCIAGEPPVPEEDDDPCTAIGECNEDTDAFDVLAVTDDPRCVDGAAVPTASARDYAYVFWPTNHRPTETWPTPERELVFQTGHYGLVFNEATGAVPHFGALAGPATARDALQEPVDDLLALPALTLSFEAGSTDATVTADDFDGASSTTVDKAQFIDAGHTMNRIQVPDVGFGGDSGVDGAVQIASMPRHVALSLTVSGSSARAREARIRMGGDALSGLTTADWLVTDRALSLTDASGEGWVFVVYEDAAGPTTLSWSAEDGLAATRTRADGAAAGSAVTVSVVAIPTAAVSDDELAVYLQPDTAVSVTSTLMDVAGNPLLDPDPAPWDPTLGAYRLDLRPLQEAGAVRWPNYDTQPEYHNWYGRHRIDVDTLGVDNLAVPLAMHGADTLSFYITGGSPMLRDASGLPSGVPLQISKNWHGEYWYHLYASPIFGTAANQLEFTMASSRWGSAYAASHAQLSLIGWANTEAGRGHWQESAIGCFGESITYDPDMTLRRAMVDDVRPFLVRTDRKWWWTGNVGGADFLVLKTAGEPYWTRRMARVRSLIAASGPNLTDATYAGVSSDGSIQGTIRTRLSASDDLVRVLYDLDYEVLTDIEYSRLAFFQVAGDTYADNGFQDYAYGNTTGVLGEYVNTDHRTTGYESADHRGIEVPGDAPWVMLYNNIRTDGSLNESFADVGFVVRDYSVEVGGTEVLTTPHINLHRTYNGNPKWSQRSFELGLPDEDDSAWCGTPCDGRARFLPAGTRIRATVEYLVAPADPARYYGASDWLLAMDPADWSTPEMMRTLAEGNHDRLTATAGTLVQQHPFELAAEEGATAAAFTFTGGLGRVPVTVSGLVRHDGWQLQRDVEGTWTAIDQSVHGDDFWQADFDAATGTWALTWSLVGAEAGDYRVFWPEP